MPINPVESPLVSDRVAATGLLSDRRFSSSSRSQTSGDSTGLMGDSPYFRDIEEWID
ncbi:MAG TPA: hypothetical protein VL485_29710 [Ktedonobacteraceae bacterium]|nr:hypothetical protein [Ktedonobacteraceae bacterium]